MTCIGFLLRKDIRSEAWEKDILFQTPWFMVHYSWKLELETVVENVANHEVWVECGGETAYAQRTHKSGSHLLASLRLR